jgi:hypothetical protein
LQHGSINPSVPLLDASAFESPSGFNFYSGQGPRVENFRQPSYRNNDIALEKRIPINEKFTFSLRGEFFNAWNWHYFNSVGLSGANASMAFVNDVASPDFGKWNGEVTNPRNIQVSARLKF